jgi:cyclic pyranopterin phosphate synthase
MRAENVDDEQLAARMASVWMGRDDHYSELRGHNTKPLHKVEMSYIGG